jgi:hypothetical protein
MLKFEEVKRLVTRLICMQTLLKLIKVPCSLFLLFADQFYSNIKGSFFCSENKLTNTKLFVYVIVVNKNCLLIKLVFF